MSFGISLFQSLKGTNPEWETLISPELKIEALDKENITVYKLRDIPFKISSTFVLTCIFELVFPYKSLLVSLLLVNITT